ncbi:MAG TPA: DUF58 domain-containing protein [Usitatibacter sp.]|nr:DUF58 domain-containing protein [Usitatibacter sp.]
MASAREDRGQSVASADLAGLAALDRYLSVPLVFGLLSAAAFLIAWNRGIALMHAVLALCAGIAAVSIAGAWWMLRPARVRFALPREASVGDLVTVSTSVEATRGPRRRWLVELVAPLPFAPSGNVFLSSCGDGEVATARFAAERRGVFALAGALARSAYPVGLFALRRRWAVEPVEITIFPRVLPVERFSVGAGSARLAGELERPSPSLGQEFFREVRDYRSGDNPRHIHWRSSAHHGRLIVRQFDAIATSETWNVLDLDPSVHAGAGASHTLEYALELAASLASYRVRSGVRCGMAGGLRPDGTFALWRPPEAGSTHFQALMYALAGVRVERCADYADALSALAGHARRGQQWVLFNHGTRGMRIPPELRGEDVVRFDFDTPSFEDPDRLSSAVRQPPRRLPGGFVIAADTDLAAVFR